MILRLLTLSAAVTLIAAGQPQASQSHVAIKIAPENDRVSPLPLSATEAANRFGRLSPAQASIATSISEQLFAELRSAKASEWKGPSLFLSHSTDQDYRPASIADLRKELRGQGVTLFDPYSLGQTGDETDAVVMAKIQTGPNSSAKWAAIAFVMNGEKVERVVVAPQPWIRLMGR